MKDIYIDDLLAKREKGQSTATRFLNEAENALICKELDARKEDYITFGGYDGALRTRVIFPAYWESETLSKTEYVTSVRISGTGYTELRHSDFLGSLTGLGISRDAVGDIVVADDKNSAVVFVQPTIADFLLSVPQPLERVGRDKVRTEIFEITDGFSFGVSLEEINVSVSSMRLDCIVAALCGVSREEAKGLIASEKVTRNYIIGKSADEAFGEGDIVSVRGKGKYRIEEVSGVTRKGKIRIRAGKYN